MRQRRWMPWTSRAQKETASGDGKYQRSSTKSSTSRPAGASQPAMTQHDVRPIVQHVIQERP